ncbi:MAG TPA: PsbP-related protein [Puia sp.]|jgi:serine/threonine-protein kinase|nr:PsbP-related protein [Puia sp.]
MYSFIHVKSLFLLLIPGWLTYTSQTGKFSMQYPKEWSPKAQNNAILFLSPKADAQDQFQENVNIILQDLSSQPMTLEQYTDMSKQQLIQAFGAKAVLSQGATTIAGQKAQYMVYSFTYQGRSLKIKGVWFIKGKTAYLLTYTAEPSQYAKYEQTATAIINSFSFN